MTDRTDARELTVALWIITSGTIIAALVLATIGQLLIAAAVCLLGGLPIALIAWGIDRQRPPRGSAENRAAGLQQGFRITVTGAVATTLGGMLLMALPDTIGSVPEALLSVGAILLLGGVTARRHAQPRQLSATDEGPVQRASATPARRGVDLLLVQKRRDTITLWVASVSALAVGPVLFDLTPRLAIGASVLLLGSLPLAALAITHRLARAQGSDL